jgi:hypothetical protein
MAPEDVQRLLELAAAAAPGPWREVAGPDRRVVLGASGWPVAAFSVIDQDVADPLTPGDAAFIAAAREAVPALAQEVLALRDQVAALRALLGETPVLRLGPEAANSADAATADYARRLADWAPRARAALKGAT